MEVLPACVNCNSPEIQNELIELLGSMIRERICREVQQSGAFYLMSDESRDVSKDEQLAVVIKYVLHGNVYERFLSMTPLKDLSAEGIANDICQVLTRNGVNLLNCISQTYDGASVMSGKHRGVQKKIRDITGKALYVHYYAHRLNLVVVDTVKSLVSANDFFSLLQKLYILMSSAAVLPILLKYRRDTILREANVRR